MSVSGTGDLTAPSAVTNAREISQQTNRMSDAVNVSELETFGNSMFPADYRVLSQREYDRSVAQKNIIQSSGAQLTYNLGDRDLVTWQKATDGLRKWVYDTNFVKILTQFNNDPANLDKFRKLYPEFFKLRLQYITQVAKLQARWAAIKLMGIQTKEDLNLILTFQVMDPVRRQDLLRLLGTSVYNLDVIKNGLNAPYNTGSIIPMTNTRISKFRNADKIQFNAAGLLQFVGASNQPILPAISSASTQLPPAVANAGAFWDRQIDPNPATNFSMADLSFHNVANTTQWW